MKFIALKLSQILLHIAISWFVASLVIRYHKYDTIKTNVIQAHIVEAEYIAVRESNRFGDQPQITIQAREDFAGINMTDGNKSDISLWCNRNGAKIIND
jgi:hypothetical protein